MPPSGGVGDTGRARRLAGGGVGWPGASRPGAASGNGGGFIVPAPLNDDGGQAGPRHPAQWVGKGRTPQRKRGSTEEGGGGWLACGAGVGQGTRDGGHHTPTSRTAAAAGLGVKSVHDEPPDKKWEG